jgi:hypothetical protein
MQILKELETAPIPIEEEERRHTRRLIAGVLCALIIAGLLLGGYLYVRKRLGGASTSAASAKAKVARPPKVEIFVDEATLKDKDTLLGGTVHNISNETYRNLMIELELQRRLVFDKGKFVEPPGGRVETKAVPLEVSELGPGASARYAITLSAKDYITASLVRVVAGDNHAEVPFKTLPGTPRPLETPVPGKTIVVKRPVPSGEQFINTPDKPERVP